MTGIKPFLVYGLCMLLATCSTDRTVRTYKATSSAPAKKKTKPIEYNGKVYELR